MRVGFLVSSVSRKAGGLFQSVRGLAKAAASTSADVRVFGLRDEQSAVDLQEWQPLSVQTFRPRLRAWGYSNELVPAMLNADLDILSVHGLWKYCSVASHRWHRQTGCPYVVHPHGMLEPWAVRNAMWKKRIAALLYENQHLARGRLPAGPSRKLKHNRSAVMDYAIRFASFPMGLICRNFARATRKLSRPIEKLFFTLVDFTLRRKTSRI